jgi:hypothetical protein
MLQHRIQRIEQAVEQRQRMEEPAVVPRRKRRVYDRPKHDTNIEQYAAWRVFASRIDRPDQYEQPKLAFKIKVCPQLLLKTVGVHSWPSRFAPASTREYYFEDDSLSQYVLYDFRETTQYHGANLQDYDYDSQLHIEPRKRKTKYPSLQEFWAQDEVELRCAATPHAEYMKFKAWLTRRLEAYRHRPHGFDEEVDQALGNLNGYNSYRKYDILTQPAIYAYTSKDLFSPEQDAAKKAVEPASSKKKDKKKAKVEAKTDKAEAKTDKVEAKTDKVEAKTDTPTAATAPRSQEEQGDKWEPAIPSTLKTNLGKVRGEMYLSAEWYPGEEFRVKK